MPLTDPELKTYSGVLAYARFLDLWGKSAKFDVIVPYTFLPATRAGTASRSRARSAASPIPPSGSW